MNSDCNNIYGEHCLIDPTSQIMASTVSENSKIFRHARLFSSIIGISSTIGDFSTIRESRIDDFCQIQRHCDIMRTRIGRYTCLERMSVAHDVEIGSFCAISWNVSMGGDNHDFHQPTIHPFYYNSTFGIEENPELKKQQDILEAQEEPCKIGNDVWIGCGVIINRGITIGNGACIGAGSVVTRDVPPYAVVVGTPARVIKYRFDESVIDRLQKVAWWNWPVDVLKANRHLFKSHLDESLLSQMEEITENFSKGKHNK